MTLNISKSAQAVLQGKPIKAQGKAIKLTKHLIQKTTPYLTQWLGLVTKS